LPAHGGALPFLRGGTDIPCMADPIPLCRPARCPICGRQAAAEFRPFCSRRCADIDLNRWLSGAYVIPGAETDEEEPEDSHEGG
jgi:endogenous inhibitor of DNA gyrase (YacG/DUF329 family)